MPRRWCFTAISRPGGGEWSRPYDGDFPPLMDRLGLVAEDMARVSVV